MRQRRHRGPRGPPAQGRGSAPPRLRRAQRTAPQLLPHRRAGARRAFDPAVVSGLARKTLTSSSTPLLGLLDSFRYNVVPSSAGRQRLVVDVVLSDSGERARLELRHSVLRVDKTADDPDATLSLPKDRFLALASGSTTWDTLQQDDAVEVAGEPEVLARFLACFDLAPPRVQLHVR
ncbi:alkyl sulfatase C-terminal domain-containing protein [Streptomyces sp. NPDC101165]|uniref:alkyl sulfatase C-terminal domain-containing protein n=1 Tax=Streptomyces sp. NPDC101165 TaxID=3366119 RepID=UPI0038202CE8